MSTLKDHDAVIAAWLEDGPERMPVHTRQAIVVGVRAVAQRKPGISWPLSGSTQRFFELRGSTVALGSALVIVLAVVVALGFMANQPGIGGPATPSPSPSATPSPVPSESASPSPGDGSLPVGPYVMDPGQTHGEDRVTVTISAPGWFEGPFAASISKDLGGGDRVTVVAVAGDHYKVPRDICGWQTTPDDRADRIADTLDDLAAYLMEQTYDTPTASLTREFSPPEAITLDGHPGQLIRSVAPLDPNSDRGDCDRDPSEGQFSQQRVFCSLQDRDGWECLLAHLEPGALDTLWLVDADQAWFRVVAASYSPTTSAELLAEMNAIVDSMTFAD